MTDLALWVSVVALLFGGASLSLTVKFELERRRNQIAELEREQREVDAQFRVLREALAEQRDDAHHERERIESQVTRIRELEELEE